MRSSSSPGDSAAGFTRRSFTRIAALGLVAGAGAPGAASAAATAEGGGQVYYDRARALAGSDPVLLALARALTPGVELPRPPSPAPIKLFDNLVMLSAGWVSAMAVLTGEGIVLIDALTSAAEAEAVVVGGLREVGAAPETIRYVVVTHGHDDHFGGAQYLADRYGARVLMTPADWDLVARADPDHAPARDLEIADGQCLALGGTSIRLHHTPGHTAGTVSPIIPLRAGRMRHTAMLWGGTNPPVSLTELRSYRAAIRSFRARMREAGVDVELSNHPNDHGLQRAEKLRQQPEGGNPFVLGRPRAQRYMAVMDLMLRGRIAAAHGPPLRK
ncbi:MBL fold metallo-hydrolase [Streptomyces sp. NPDC000349]|uniref:MBL fold metallo-hydrolase n=1 Tax=unclassified Streptomyces TaxID=2593676 RepID=UPI00277F0F69|nr:MBL fold metallo-hydrolase [Streptomyces sp. DSM 40167]MDQ0408514.1 metallo-beta-lactamase class B [Streptomyces sp. DSM 40167]